MGGSDKAGRLHISKTLTKMLLSYFLIILISISMISIVLYYKFSTATIGDIQISMQDKLAQNMNQLELIRSQVYALGLQLINDSILVDAMYRNESDRVAIYLATRKLMQVKDANPMIQSVYIYNSKTRQFISNLGTAGETSETAMISIARSGKSQFIPFSHTYKTNRGDMVKENIISFIFSDSTQIYSQKPADINSIPDSFICINLNAEYIQKSFTAVDFSKNTEMLLLNLEGDVICDSDFKKFSKNIISQEYIKTIINSEKKSGYLINKDGSGQFLITYYSSENIPLLFVNKSNYTTLLERVYSLRLTIIIICIAIFLLCVIIAILSAYKVYLPYRKLVTSIKRQLSSDADNKPDKRIYNEIEYLARTFSKIIRKSNELETSMQENVPLLRKMFLKGLLEGNLPSLSDASKRIADMKFDNKSGRLYVLLFSIDGYSKFSRPESNFDQYGIKLEIENIINDEISSSYKMEMVDLEGDLLAVIINTNNDLNLSSTIMESLTIVKSNVSARLGVTITAVIGMSVDGFENIHLSFGNCLELLKYRFVYGYNSILDNNLIQINLSKKYTYIGKEKKNILEAIKACDKEQMEAEINEIIMLITDNQYDYIRLTLNQLTLDIMKTVEALLNTEDTEVDFNNIYNNLNNMDTLEEVRDWFVFYCSGIIQKLEGKKDGKQKDMIETALSYLEDNYYKPELSIELLSDIVNITPGYFGKLFSKYMQKSFNEYIIELRMKKAKELLENSSNSVNDIATTVGYTNQSYFTSIFKKCFGITPNQYRIDLKKS